MNRAVIARRSGVVSLSVDYALRAHCNYLYKYWGWAIVRHLKLRRSATILTEFRLKNNCVSIYCYRDPVLEIRGGGLSFLQQACLDSDNKGYKGHICCLFYIQSVMKFWFLLLCVPICPSVFELPVSLMSQSVRVPFLYSTTAAMVCTR